MTESVTREVVMGEASGFHPQTSMDRKDKRAFGILITPFL